MLFILFIIAGEVSVLANQMSAITQLLSELWAGGFGTDKNISTASPHDNLQTS